MSKILFLARENKIHIFKPPCNVLFIIIYRQKDIDKIKYKFWREITKITSLINSCEIMENKLHGSWM